MYEDRIETSKFGRGAKGAMGMCVITLLGYLCYSLGYNQGRTAEVEEIHQTSQSVADALNRLAAKQITEERS